jgi:hypothetical protein
VTAVINFNARKAASRLANYCDYFASDFAGVVADMRMVAIAGRR